MSPAPDCQRGVSAHEVGRNRAGHKVCKHCYTSLQTITSGSRSPVAGDLRVVCDGIDGDGVCSIGPSEPIPPALEDHALGLYNAHQREAVERDGQPHDAEVITL